MRSHLRQRGLELAARPASRGRSEAGVRTGGGAAAVAAAGSPEFVVDVPLALLVADVPVAASAARPAAVGARGRACRDRQGARQREHHRDHDDDQRRGGGQPASQAVSSSSTVCGPTHAIDSRSSIPAAIARTSS